MILMGIDPGVRTGVAVFDTNSKRRDLYTVQGWSALDSFVKLENPDQIVIEKLPESTNHDNEFFRYEERMRLNRLSVVSFAPSQWKPIARARNWKVPEAKTAHESDALNLLRYFFFIQKSDFLEV